MHVLYNCRQSSRQKYGVSRGCHVLQLSFSVTPVLSTEFAMYPWVMQDDYWALVYIVYF